MFCTFFISLGDNTEIKIGCWTNYAPATDSANPVISINSQQQRDSEIEVLKSRSLNLLTNLRQHSKWDNPSSAMIHLRFAAQDMEQ